MANRERQREALKDPNEHIRVQLSQHNRSTKVAPVVSPEDIGKEIFRAYGEFAIRSPRDFNRSLKTKDIGKIRLAYATHLFGKYTTPYHLQRVWFENSDHQKPSIWGPQIELRKAPNRSELLKRMFITVATGGSLYKMHTKDILTKKETHNFVTCPLKLTFEEAMFYALAKSHTDDLGVITRIYKSKLVNKDYTDEFWRDVVRFFCVNPVIIHEMNDLLDYINHARTEEGSYYSLKGRTLGSLKIQMEQWHRSLARAKRMGNAKWDGIAVEDSEFKDMIGSEKNKNVCDWKFNQIKTSKELAAEGTSMHHCVYSYQSSCISGRVSIWSLKRKATKEFNYNERVLTIEVINQTKRVVQIRGYANRIARPYEMAVVRSWARANQFFV